MTSISEGFAKCWGCIQDGEEAGSEKPVIVFHNYGVCLCEKHLNKIIEEYYNLNPFIEK